MFIKIGELLEITRVESADSCLPAISAEVLENFKKYAANLKRIAPKAEDFLYFSAVMMHSAEASALNDDGTNKTTLSGDVVKVGWDKSGGTWRWMSNDSSIKPYKNSNGDIFPEEELVKAYRKWVGKPLCIDHKSSSVDHVRGIIVDTYYDRALKRVIALCALDKANYPELAKKVSTGVSNCVSMGTAVGKAICSDCARVARTEADFCDHMRRKSCYGEINIDLNPIELSIVVNGADPRANIKNVLAAANALNAYVEQKGNELNKLAEMQYSASLNFSDPTKVGSNDEKTGSINISAPTLEQLNEDINKAIEDFKKINAENTNHSAFNQSSGTVAMDETEVSDTQALAPPNERFASLESADKESIDELHAITAIIETKLSHMKQNLDKLSKNSTLNTQEENMSGSNEMNKKGYYQGTEEPTPGQAKYPKDPLNEKLRTDGDKQMEGQSPFPGVGSVDGMHPSPDSSGQTNELERKKMLARAEAEERVLRRTAIVNLAKQTLENKRAWFQNGDDKNPGTPTPGQVKYPKDKLNEQLRDREDKQMVGQKPFPGVGSVDGLHPSPNSADTSDELKRKEMLRRAALRARFVKASNEDGTANLGNSAWEVYLGEKLLLTASVNELSGGRAEMLHDSIATKEFGTRLIEKVKVQGADKVSSLIKKAAPPVAPAAPADMGAPVAPPADMGAAPEGDAGVEDVGAGDPVQQVKDLAKTLTTQVSDLTQAADLLDGDKKEMGAEEAPPTDTAGGNFSTASLNSLRRELNGALSSAIKEAVAELNGHKQELDMIADIYSKGAVNPSNEDNVTPIIEDALNDAKTAVADGFKLMTAFVKYARGTKAIVKRAEIEAELEALAEGDNMTGSMDDHSTEELMSLLNDHDTSDLGSEHHDLGGEDYNMPSDMPSDDGLDGLDAEFLADDNDLKVDDLKPGTELPPDAFKTQASFQSKEGRAALRSKLAADALGKQDDGQLQDMSHAKFNSMLDDAHRLADGQTHLDVKPSDDLGLVETIEERNKAMMEVAKMPPKVRKEAEAIHRLVSEGKLDPADLDALVAEGLDKDAVAYYKKYWSQTDGGSEFASELVKEHVKAQLEEELNKYRVKMARAYELAYDMVERGLCHAERSSVSSQVDEIMKFNDENFDALKRVVARHAPLMRKEAGGRLPQVGMIGSGEVNTSSAPADENMFAQLSAAFSKTSKKMF